MFFFFFFLFGEKRKKPQKPKIRGHFEWSRNEQSLEILFKNILVGGATPSILILNDDYFLFRVVFVAITVMVSLALIKIHVHY